MSTPSSDRNLLFGILALQMDFITRDALIAAMNAWALEKATPLGQILADRGDLDPADRALLEPMVERHIHRHGGDPHRSLATLSTLGSVREALAQVPDPDIHASLAAVASAHPDADGTADPFATRLSSVGAPTSVGTRFIILRPHERGGLGQVYVARDTELDRPVALKEILLHLADEPSSRERFVAEAEITGKLEHPGIVPVYGLGHYPDGRPFYAMRFIKGRSLKEAIAAFHCPDGPPPGSTVRTLKFRELLNRFLDVCNAVAYAHKRGVLHRDLKPGNVMLGPFGETLVVDWGLAKPLGSSSDADAADYEPVRLSALSVSHSETVTGSAIGTPAFASPEQCEGRLDLLSPATDVYGLGSILYSLLTGHPPVESPTLDETLRRSIVGDIPSPRTLDPTIPRTLEAICLKALSLRPADRYPTALDLAADLHRWLADEPVSARTDSWSDRLARWTRRHRSATRAAAVTLVIISVVSIVSAIFIDKSRRGERAALKKVSIALAAETKAKTEAEAQHKRAEDREQLAIDAVKKFRDSVVNNPELSNREDLKHLRDTLLKEPLEFFRTLREQLQTSHDTRPETLARLASASFQLGSTAALVGSLSDALQAYEESLAVQARLAQDYPNVAEFQRNLAEVLVWTADTHRALGHTSEAIDMFRKALGILERLVAENTTGSGLHRDLANHYERFALLYSFHGDRSATAGLELHRKAMQLRERLARDHPDNDQYQYDLGGSYYWVGFTQLQMGQPAEALESLLQSDRLRLQHGPSVDSRYLEKLAGTRQSIGIAQVRLGRRNEALGTFRFVLEVNEASLQSNPNHHLINDLSDTYECIGSLLGAGQTATRLEWLRKSLAMRERLALENPSVPWYQAALGKLLFYVGEAQGELGQSSEAIQSLQKAVEVEEQLEREHPHMRGAVADWLGRANLAATHNAIGQLQLSIGRQPDASESFRKALERYETDDSLHPDALVGRYDQTRAILIQMGRLADVVDVNQKALLIRERQALEHPDNIAYQEDLLRRYIDQFIIMVQLGQKDEALYLSQDALDTFQMAQVFGERLARNHPELANVKSLLGITFHHLAGLDTQYDQQAVREAYRQAIAHQKQALTIDPGNMEYRLHLGNHLFALSRTTVTHGLPLEAAEAARELATLMADNPSHLYNASCNLALCVPLVKDEAEQTQYADEAMAILHSAVAAGWARATWIARDPDLIPLRDRADFSHLLAELFDRSFPKDPFER